MKHKHLNPADLMRLDSARGLNVRFPPTYRDNRGLRPSIKDYNLAVKKKMLIGRPING